MMRRPSPIGGLDGSAQRSGQGIGALLDLPGPGVEILQARRHGLRVDHRMAYPGHLMAEVPGKAALRFGSEEQLLGHADPLAVRPYAGADDVEEPRGLGVAARP